MAGGGSSSCCHEARDRRAVTAAGQGKKARARPPVVAVEVEANGMAAEWHPQLVLLLLTTIARNQRILHEPSCTSEGKP